METEEEKVAAPVEAIARTSPDPAYAFSVEPVP